MFKAISKLFQKKIDPEILNDYLKWREVIFSVNSTQVDVMSGKLNQVYGVIMDVGISNDFIITITAFSTGESSVRTTVGGGGIGFGGDEKIAEHAKRIVTLAQPLLDKAKPNGSHNLPTSQKVYYYFLTTSGIMLSKTTVEETSVHSHSFFEIFRQFMEIKTRSEELIRTYAPK